MQGIMESVLNEVRKVVTGKDDIILKVMLAITARGHILIDDIPGVGKTTMAMGFARAMGCKCNRIQFTPDVMPSDIMGFSAYNPKTQEFEYRDGAAMCNLLLAEPRVKHSQPFLKLWRKRRCQSMDRQGCCHSRLP